ncbi:MAG: ATP-grasp domain-containing protein [Clostridia bacterium]|nr:ATP-grasp domain-containing protein [Clostridia bacterium]
MKNFIFISPNFPDTYWRFCRELKHNGFNVLGIGDSEYFELSNELRASLTEYYKVSSLENYDEVYRAVAFFSFRYGKIDWLESNNEYWLEQDAKLRTDFNITSGFHIDEMPKVKFKSEMKTYYKKAGIKVARHCIATDEKTCKKFIEEVGYPVIVKPDNGVGANDTHKLENDEDLQRFFQTKYPVSYIMEEYIQAEVNSYDAIVNSQGEPIFETGNVTPLSLMDVVTTNDTSLFYILNKPFDDVKAAGRKVLKAFGVKSRFVHFEFFRLTCDQHIGKKGEVVALEVNMRPSGGISPDMMNYANSTDVYKIWADMIAFDKSDLQTGEKYFCAFAGRRDGRHYVFREQDIRDKFYKNLKIVGRVPRALSGAMGDTMYIANFKTQAELDEFFAEMVAERQ